MSLQNELREAAEAIERYKKLLIGVGIVAFVLGFVVGLMF